MEIGGRYKKSEVRKIDIALWANSNGAVLEDDGDYWVLAKPSVDTHLELVQLRNYLRSTDWCVVKCMELGQSIDEVYSEISIKRKEARVRINEIEEQLD